jgi:hypothetical protein
MSTYAPFEVYLTLNKCSDLIEIGLDIKLIVFIDLSIYFTKLRTDNNNKPKFRTVWIIVFLENLSIAHIFENISLSTEHERAKPKQTPWPIVRKRTIPTDRPPFVDEI